jgi:hypothetical protein
MPTQPTQPNQPPAASSTGLNTSHGSVTPNIQDGVSTEKEQSLLEMVTELRNELIETRNEMGLLRQAADPNRLNDAKRSQSNDIDYMLVTVASLDGIDPILDWKIVGNVYIDSFKNEVDSQKAKYLTKSGEKGEIAYAAFFGQIVNFAIKGKTNNIRTYLNKDRLRVHEPKEPNDMISVTLSTDDGQTYKGDTIQIKYSQLNPRPNAPIQE